MISSDNSAKKIVTYEFAYVVMQKFTSKGYKDFVEYAKNANNFLFLLVLVIPPTCTAYGLLWFSVVSDSKTAAIICKCDTL